MTGNIAHWVHFGSLAGSPLVSHSPWTTHRIAGAVEEALFLHPVTVFAAQTLPHRLELLIGADQQRLEDFTFYLRAELECRLSVVDGTTRLDAKVARTAKVSGLTVRDIVDVLAAPLREGHCDSLRSWGGYSTLTGTDLVRERPEIMTDPQRPPRLAALSRPEYLDLVSTGLGRHVARQATGPGTTSSVSRSPRTRVGSAAAVARDSWPTGPPGTPKSRP